MGQYYVPVLKRKGKITVYDNYLKGDVECYNGLKLTEHSWLGNRWIDTIASQLYNTKCKVAWIGDYSDHPDELFWEHQDDITFDFVWNHARVRPPYHVVNLKDKFLINHTKKLYIDMKKYIENSIDNDGFVAHPLPLLTAVGNGKGGGDYYGIYEEIVGTWAWDELSIKDKPLKGCKEFNIIFNENIQKGGV